MSEFYYTVLAAHDAKKEHARQTMLTEGWNRMLKYHPGHPGVLNSTQSKRVCIPPPSQQEHDAKWGEICVNPQNLVLPRSPLPPCASNGPFIDAFPVVHIPVAQTPSPNVDTIVNLPPSVPERAPCAETTAPSISCPTLELCDATCHPADDAEGATSSATSPPTSPPTSPSTPRASTPVASSSPSPSCPISMVDYDSTMDAEGETDEEPSSDDDDNDDEYATVVNRPVQKVSSRALRSSRRDARSLQAPSTPPAFLKSTSTKRSSVSQGRKMVSKKLAKHPCHLCDKICASAGDLKRHLLSARHAEPQFACHKCSQTFTRDDALKRHHSQKRCKAGRRQL
ncbi:hypothetical protein HWV62_31251 [Athelia sp. TMB]|nr:hypothetical protein HWV62_31251 [Athelia sp. TMB]